VNPFVAVAIIIGVFFVAGLAVGFLIVMALPALLGGRGSRRGWRTYDEQGPRWPEPRGWPGTRPFGADPDDANPADDYRGPDVPPGIPWWRDNR
jgi:hypothetical protein